MSSPPPGSRRSPGPRQRRRSALTQERVVAATVQMIRERGPDAVTAAEISRRSGVSWGGVQHQFGSKSAVMDAALEWLVGDLSSQWQAPHEPGPAPEDRAGALVALVWAVVWHPSFAPLMALLRARPAHGRTAEALAQLRDTARSTTREVLGASDLPTDRADAILAFCFGALSGIVEQQALVPVGEDRTERLLALVRAGVLEGVRGNP